MSKVIIKSDHQRREMNSVFRQVGGIIVTLQLSSFDLSLDIVLHDLFVKICKQEAASTTCHPVVLTQQQ